jgi:hypothetical protein
MSEKYDPKKALAKLYKPTAKEFTIVDVPEMNFLMVDGHGNPNTSLEYAEALNALYSVAYTLKFMLKKEGVEYGVGPSEGLWWVKDMAQFTTSSKDEWDWTMMIMVPAFVSAESVEKGRLEAGRKKDLPALPKLRFTPFHEGLSMQIMYFGAYADEGPTIARMHALIAEKGYVPNGKHHEIYLGDPRRTAPEKLKTVIRQPVRPA